jgi:hypothetical protein
MDPPSFSESNCIATRQLVPRPPFLLKSFVFFGIIQYTEVGRIPYCDLSNTLYCTLCIEDHHSPCSGLRAILAKDWRGWIGGLEEVIDRPFSIDWSIISDWLINHIQLIEQSYSFDWSIILDWLIDRCYGLIDQSFYWSSDHIRLIDRSCSIDWSIIFGWFIMLWIDDPLIRLIDLSIRIDCLIRCDKCWLIRCDWLISRSVLWDLLTNESSASSPSPPPPLSIFFGISLLDCSQSQAYSFRAV